MTVRTRFAPSPTGFMHVGNLRTALYAYLLAKSQGGKFILRIEDTDQARYVDGAVEVIYNTLRTAGLEHDEGPDRPGGFGPYVQSERKHLYQPYAEQLVKSGAAYYCFCGKNEDAEPGENHSEVIGYDGHCRNLAPEVVAANLAAGKPYVIRQKIDKEGESSFTDAVFGTITIPNKQLDDQILIKQDGMPTYNFANVIDDHLMGITHVVRGAEYLPSTPKYNLLYRAFGWEIPEYVHLPLIMGKNPDGSVGKLSKRHGSVSFENLVQEGYLPEAIINYIALLGWSPKDDGEIFSLSELRSRFSVAGLNKSPAVFDYEKLRWMNGEYLKKMPLEDFLRAALPFAGVAGTALEPVWPALGALLQQRICLYSEIPEKIDFFRELPDYDVSLFLHKKNKSTFASSQEILNAVRSQIAGLEPFDLEHINAFFSSYVAEKGVKFGPLMWPIRIALSGLTVTPGGATEIMAILGKEETLRRIGIALEKLSHAPQETENQPPRG